MSDDVASAVLALGSRLHVITGTASRHVADEESIDSYIRLVGLQL